MERTVAGILTVGRIRRLLLVLCVLWLPLAWLVVPALIETAYQGESLSFLNRVIAGQSEHTVDYYLQKWNSLSIGVLLIGFQAWLLLLVAGSETVRRVARMLNGMADPSTDVLASTDIAARRESEVTWVPGLDVLNRYSILALIAICVPLTVGAILVLPLYDDGWLWLLLREQGAAALSTSLADRPFMAALWSLLASSERAFWVSAFVAQAALWPTLAIASAVLWTYLFPSLRRYAMTVGCVTVAPIIAKVQLVAAVIALGPLLSVVLAYCALILSLYYVTMGDRVGRWPLVISAPLLASAILLTEYALPVVIVTVFLLWAHQPLADGGQARVRAWRAIGVSSATAVAAYVTYFLIANYGARPGGGGEVSPSYIFFSDDPNAPLILVKTVGAVWRSVAGAFMVSLGQIGLTTTSGLMAAAYGALVAALLFHGSREPRNHAGELAACRAREVLTAAVAMVLGLLPIVAMARAPWNPGDAMQSRFEVPLLPLAATLFVVAILGLVRRRYWAIPILIIGFAAGNATFNEVWEAVQERKQVAALGAALQPEVSSKEGYTVAAIALPERSLGPRRAYELTARLTATWPDELRRRFWAFRYAGGPPNYGLFMEAEGVFGVRGKCEPPRQFHWSLRQVTRDGPLDQLLWVRPATAGSVAIEPFCTRAQGTH